MEITIKGLSVWKERCHELSGSINVIMAIFDVKDEFKE